MMTNRRTDKQTGIKMLIEFYKEIINIGGIEKMQKFLEWLWEMAAENAIKINPGRYRAVPFTGTRVKDPQKYPLGDQLIPEASSCK